MADRIRRLERLGYEVDELAHLLDTTQFTIANWLSGTMSLEESDMFEVALSMLELHRARAAARQQVTQRIAAYV